MSAHDKVLRTSFSEIEFPGVTHTLHGKGRHHIHEYAHTPGGSPEKFGRALYNCTVRGTFHDRFREYPDLYPNGLNKLRVLYETQVTRQFVHPTAGSYPAFIIDWRQVKESKSRSGEMVDIEFLEDQKTLFLAASIAAPSVASMQSLATKLAGQLALIKAQLAMSPQGISVFDAIQTSANAVFAIKDTANMYGNLFEAKVLQLTSLCNKADRLTEVQDPRAWPVVDALHDLWSASIKLTLDLQSKSVPLQIFPTKIVMSVAAISIAIYGDATHQLDIIALNGAAAQNPLRVPAGTAIKYYPVAPLTPLGL